MAWGHPPQKGKEIMLGIVKAAAVVGALLAPPVAYVAHSASRTVTMGTTTVRLKTGTTGTMEMFTALRVLSLVPGVLVFSLRVAFSC
jgi:hypothetical protein